MKNLTLHINLPSLLGFLASLGAAYSLATGKAQEVVHFADPLNEMACFACCVMLVAGFAISAFSFKK